MERSPYPVHIRIVDTTTGYNSFGVLAQRIMKKMCGRTNNYYYSHICKYQYSLSKRLTIYVKVRSRKTARLSWKFIFIRLYNFHILIK